MMICDVCGLPKELCVCSEIAKEAQKVKIYTSKRRFGKLVTVVEGLNEKEVNPKDLMKTLKSVCACGGTYKNSKIELQGEHKEKAKSALIKAGFSPDAIELK